MYLKLYPENPNQKEIQKIVEELRRGGIIIYPTDTVYGMGCDIFNRRSVEKIAHIKGIDLKKANFSFICSDMSHLSYFTKPIENSIFKLMKNHLPGPFTFILPASNTVPKLFMSKKKTVGIRIPDNPIIIEIVKEFGHPIMTTSILDDDEVKEYTTDPELIYEKYKNIVNVVVDGGYGGNVPSTVVDCTKEPIEIIRQGLGEI